MNGAAASPQAYRQGAVLAASRGQLVVMLYDGARRFLRQAAAAMRAGEVERGHNALRRAEMIVGHLDATLDFEQGLVAERLHAIYAFCLEQLSASRFTQDARRLDEIGELLGELREAWGQIADEAPVAS
jgi:flagellar secretion chaperone FliS